ncbi:MAG TPA: peptidoglycan DD-metalloendopeptidase family protein [Dongiaceae bacterium]|nr:peptidoglycan DD-metalloendopeptidase family protein [Dongiaceae bacterium]
MKGSRFRVAEDGPRSSSFRRLNDRFDRWFPPRELILRTDGRVAYLAITTRHQKLAATILFGFLLWGGFATTNMIISGRQLEAKRTELDRAQLAYADLLNQVTKSYDQLIAFARGVSGSEGSPMNPADMALLPGRPPEAAPAHGQDAGLRDKLRLFALDLQSVATHNDQLSRTVASLQNELTAAKAQSQALAQARQSVSSQLESTRLQLTSELEAMQRILALADSRKQELSDQVASLQKNLSSVQQRAAEGAQARGAAEEQLAQLMKQFEQTRADRQALVAQIASLQQEIATAQTHEAEGGLSRQAGEEQIGTLLAQLAAARSDNARLMRQIADTQTALATALGQRDALQAARRDLTARVGELENQLASIQRSQQTIVDRLAARTRNGVDEVEKTVAMTGVDVDGLLLRAARELSGQGGPFIPVKEPPMEGSGRQLMASVASLDGEVGRLETLQLVLRTLPLTAPVDHYFVASNFGIRRDPFNNRLAMHEGLDLANALLSPVLATSPGVVVYAGWNGGYGRMVEIDHGLGVHTRYGHLARIDVKVGDTVDYREQIGLLGSSGRSSGPHVHYEVRVDGRPLDPMNFLKAGRYVFKG